MNRPALGTGSAGGVPSRTRTLYAMASPMTLISINSTTTGSAPSTVRTALGGSSPKLSAPWLQF